MEQQPEGRKPSHSGASKDTQSCCHYKPQPGVPGPTTAASAGPSGLSPLLQGTLPARGFLACFLHFFLPHPHPFCLSHHLSLLLGFVDWMLLMSKQSVAPKSCQALFLASCPPCERWTLGTRENSSPKEALWNRWLCQHRLYELRGRSKPHGACFHICKMGQSYTVG